MLPVQDVPVTVVTGFLGVGKTTALRHLIAQAPEGERWAVLVNEFGEIGIDGAALAQPGLAVTEIPGGCICCSAGMSLQVSLVRLLRDVRPDRLLIEPTGLAHPASVLDTLRRPGLREALSLRATITLIDPRHLDDPRARGSDTWNDQVTVADVLVANKIDLATPQQIQAFAAFAEARWPAPLATLRVRDGQIPASVLDLDPTPAKTRYLPAGQAALAPGATVHAPDGDAASQGWIWPATTVFDRTALIETLQLLVRPNPALPAGVLRLKGLFRTPGHWLLLQADPDAVRSEPTGWRRDSRVEVIAPSAPAPDWQAVQAKLMAARLTLD